MPQRNKVSKEIISLVKLISFFKQLRHKDSLEKTGFFFVNELYNLTHYKQCVFWTYTQDKISIHSASGQIDISNQSPYAQFLKKTIKTLISQEHPNGHHNLDRDIEDVGCAHIVKLSPKNVNPNNEENLSPHTYCIFLYNQDSLIGGAWVEREKTLGEMEKAVLEDASDALANKIQFFSHKKKNIFSSILATSRYKKALLGLFLIFCLWPVRFSVTANAEIVAEDAFVVSVPYNGLIADVWVKPNQMVNKGDKLFSLDKTQLESEYALASQELLTAREKLSKTERESFIDPEKRYDINSLKGFIKQKSLELDYAKKRLDKSDITASKDGIALFSDTNDLIGKPLSVGDRVMVVADPEKTELLVKIPAESMIKLNSDVPVKFFLNTSPLKSHKGYIQNISYQAVIGADNQLTYNARITIKDKSAVERIGLMGTAKLYGNRTLMIFNILKRPLSGLRNFITF